MRIKRLNVLTVSVALVLSSVILRIFPANISWDVEFAIFNLKLGIVLLAFFFCLEEKK